LSAARGTSGAGTGVRARAVLGALSLMVLGAVIGIAIDRHLGPGERHLGPGERHASPAAALHEMTMSSLEEHLDLTAAQRLQIESIVAARHESLRYAWQAVHSQLGAAVDTVHQEIEAILTAEQRVAFREWLTETGRGTVTDRL
jgi:Spy/CpxP family protein refolding chaperone